MKIIILIMLSFGAIGGELHWQTSTGIESRLNCIISQSMHSDTRNINQYWINCQDNNIDLINLGHNGNNSFIMVNSELKLLCPIDTAFINNSNDFIIYLICDDLIYLSGF